MNTKSEKPRVAQTSKLFKSKKHPRSPSEEQVTAMVESIRSQGILEPILVAPANGGFEIHNGLVRWLAAQRLGIDIVPISIIFIDEDDASAVARIGNMVRTELETDPQTILNTMESLVKEFGVNASEIIQERLIFLREHNPNLSPEQRSRVEALLVKCGIKPA